MRKPVADRVGLGWRGELAAGIFAHVESIDLVEVIADDHYRAPAKALRALRTLAAQVPVTLHGVAMGLASCAPVENRRLERMARLWEALDARVDMSMIGFCLDTCHAHAGGEDLAGIVDRVKAITGRVDLVHANDSRDEFDSGADRHANFGSGSIDPEAIVAVVQAAGAPVVCETPGAAKGQGADIAFLRERLPA